MRALMVALGDLKRAGSEQALPLMDSVRATSAELLGLLASEDEAYLVRRLRESSLQFLELTMARERLGREIDHLAGRLAAELGTGPNAPA